MFVLCVVSIDKGKMQDNQDKDTSTDKAKTECKEIQKIIPAGIYSGSKVAGAWLEPPILI